MSFTAYLTLCFTTGVAIGSLARVHDWPMWWPLVMVAVLPGVYAYLWGIE